MDLKYIYLFIFILFGIILFNIRIYNYHPTPPSLSLTGKVEDIISNMKTGDIILLSGTQFGEKSIQFYTNSYFSHVSLIVMEPLGDHPENHPKLIPYVWEADLGQQHKEGPRVMKLMDKFERWKGNRIGCYRKIKREIDKDSVLSLVNKYIHLNMDDSMLCWLFSERPNSYFFNLFKDKNKVFCSELVAMTLQDLGVIHKEHHPTYYTPEYFHSKLDETFEPPIYFEF